MSSPAHVLITGGAGQIGYLLAFRIAEGDLLDNRPVILHLFDLPSMMKKLEGIKMELEDCVFPLLTEVIITSDIKTAFTDVDYAFLVASKPLKQGQVRRDLLIENAEIFKQQGEALSEYSKRTVKALIVGNPVNTNCLVAMTYAKNLGPENFGCLCRLDQNRSEAELAHQLHVPVKAIHKCVVWGNHAESQVPDMFHAVYDTPDGQKKVADSLSYEYLTNEFVEKIAQRAWAVQRARGSTSAASAANASLNHMKDWIFGTKDGDYSSMGIPVPENCPYGIKPGIVFSFPCTVDKSGKIHVVEGLELNDWVKQKINATDADLRNERATAFKTLGLEA